MNRTDPEYEKTGKNTGRGKSADCSKNTRRSNSGGHRKKTLLFVAGLLFFSYLFLTLGQVSAKLASRTIGSPGRTTLIFVAGTYVFFFLRGTLWVFLLRRIKLVLAYPLMSVGYILVLVVSFHFFDETLTIGKIIGALLLMAGVSAISYGEMKIHRGNSG